MFLQSLLYCASSATLKVTLAFFRLVLSDSEVGQLEIPCQHVARHKNSEFRERGGGGGLELGFSRSGLLLRSPPSWRRTLRPKPLRHETLPSRPFRISGESLWLPPAPADPREPRSAGRWAERGSTHDYILYIVYYILCTY